MLDTNKAIKQEMFNQKLYNKLDKIGDPVIASYTWEVNRKPQIPIDPIEFQALAEK